jgi:hypothetical protein
MEGGGIPAGIQEITDCFAKKNMWITCVVVRNFERGILDLIPRQSNLPANLQHYNVKYGSLTL